MCVDRLQKTNSIFHHVFKRNIFHRLFSLPPLQPLPREREQGAGIPHTPAHVTTHVSCTTGQCWLPRRGQISSPPLPYPLRAFLAPGRSVVLFPGAWQELAWKPECKCISAGGEEEGQVWILLSDNTSSNQIMGYFRGHHIIDWLGQSWRGCVGARQSMCNRIPSISLINSHRVGGVDGVWTKLHKYIRKSQEITLEPKNPSTTRVTLSPQCPGQGEH